MQHGKIAELTIHVLDFFKESTEMVQWMCPAQICSAPVTFHVLAFLHKYMRNIFATIKIILSDGSFADTTQLSIVPPSISQLRCPRARHLTPTPPVWLLSGRQIRLWLYWTASMCECVTESIALSELSQNKKRLFF